MSWWKEFADRIERDVPLGRYTWFRLGGPARFLGRPRSVVDLALMVRRARDEHIPLRVLGSGANVLVGDDGFDGVVIRLDQDAFRAVDQRRTSFNVGAGVELMPFSRRCSEQGLAGLECMAGIPATIGGAVCMNAGGRFGDFGGVVRSVQVLDADGGIEVWSRDQVGFGYRCTRLGGRIVLAAEIELVDEDPRRVLDRYEECFSFKMRTQPIADHSAGCIFKNPPGQSAGELIDRAGLKGSRQGLASVSSRHANFIVTQRGATASDVLHLIDTIRERVLREFNTSLELEIDVWESRPARRMSA